MPTTGEASMHCSRSCSQSCGNDFHMCVCACVRACARTCVHMTGLTLSDTSMPGGSSESCGGSGGGGGGTATSTPCGRVCGDRGDSCATRPGEYRAPRLGGEAVSPRGESGAIERPVVGDGSGGCCPRGGDCAPSRAVRVAADVGMRMADTWRGLGGDPPGEPPPARPGDAGATLKPSNDPALCPGDGERSCDRASRSVRVGEPWRRGPPPPPRGDAG
eukprot:349587-Chlamydomonas_euryale.AAC.2